MVERIRSLLAQFPEDEAAARELIAKDASFDALCQEYRNVVDLLDGFETEIKRLSSFTLPQRLRGSNISGLRWKSDC